MPVGLSPNPARCLEILAVAGDSYLEAERLRVHDWFTWLLAFRGAFDNNLEACICEAMTRFFSGLGATKQRGDGLTR